MHALRLATKSAPNVWLCSSTHWRPSERTTFFFGKSDMNRGDCVHVFVFVVSKCVYGDRAKTERSIHPSIHRKKCPKSVDRMAKLSVVCWFQFRGRSRVLVGVTLTSLMNLGMFYAHWTETVPRLLLPTIDSSFLFRFLFCRAYVMCNVCICVCTFVCLVVRRFLTVFAQLFMVSRVTHWTCTITTPHTHTYKHTRSAANILKKAMDRISTLQIKDGLLTMRKHTACTHHTALQSVSQSAKQRANQQYTPFGLTPLTVCREQERENNDTKCQALHIFTSFDCN